MHRAARACIWPSFSSETIEGRGGEIEAIVERRVASWPRGRPTRLLPRMRQLADEVFVREVLGVRAQPRAGELAAAIGGLIWTPGNPPLTIPAAEDGLLGAAVDALYRRRRRPIASLSQDDLAERRRRAERGSGVLGLLLEDEPRQAEEALVDELLALLMGRYRVLQAISLRYRAPWVHARRHENAPDETIRFVPGVWEGLELVARRGGASSAQYVREATVARFAEDLRSDDREQEGTGDRPRVPVAIGVAVGQRYATEAVCAQAQLAHERARPIRETSIGLHARHRAARAVRAPDQAAEAM